MQELYHGSNVAVCTPEIRKTLHTLDFGTGFYTTSSFEQAKKWSIREPLKTSVFRGNFENAML